MKKLLSPIIGLCILSFVFLLPQAESYTNRSYDVYSLPVMYLDEGINTTQTTGITIARPKLNGESITVLGMSGAIFEFRRGQYKEDIYASQVSVQSDGSLLLTGSVIRDLCQYTEARTFTTCSGGLTFQRGNEVRLVNNHRLFNLKADIDRVNAFSGSGALRSSSTTQPFLFLNDFTTTQRNAIAYFGESGDAPIIKNSTLGALQWYDGSSWLTIATDTGSFVNATTTVAGKVQIASTGAILAATATGSTGAENALSARYTTAIGGATAIGKVVKIGSSGYLDVAIGGTGTGTFMSGALIVGKGTGAFGRLAPSVEGGTVQVTGGKFVVAAGTQNLVPLNVITANASTVCTSSTGEATMSTFNIAANSLAVGDRLRVAMGGISSITTGTITIRLTIGGVTVLSNPISWVGGTTTEWNGFGEITITDADSSGAMRGYMNFSLFPSTGSQYPHTTYTASTAMNFTSTMTVNATCQHSASNAGGSTLKYFTVDKILAP